MRDLAGVLLVCVLANPSAHAEGPGIGEQRAEAPGVAEPTELGKILAVMEFDPKIGKLARVHCLRVKAGQPGTAGRILVRVRSGHIARRDALQLEEMIVKSILKATPHRTVGSVRDADMILEFEFKSRT